MLAWAKGKGYNRCMSGEIPTKNPDFSEPAEKLDSRWYDRLRDAVSLNDIIKCLDGEKEHRDKEKESFLEGDKENPDLDYPGIDLGKIEQEESLLLELKKEIIATEGNEAILLAYRWKINERLAQLRMVRATKEGDMRRFKRYSEFIYGKPSVEFMALSVEEIKKQVAKTTDLNNDELRALSQELIELLPDIEATEFPEKPSEETVATVYEIVSKEFEELGYEIPTGKDDFSDEEVRDLFRIALDEIGASYWDLEIDPNRGTVYVSQEEEKVYIPKDRSIDLLKFKKLVMHEVRRHVERRVKGEKSRLSLLGLGLDRVEKAEEGVTKVTEHGIENKFKTYATPELHLAAGLAVGVDGKERNFREVFEILEKHFILKAIRAGKDMESAKKDGANKAWNHCVRVFRGTDCKTAGVAFTKDMVYREGAIAIWGLVSEDTNEVYKFTFGKYDPTNNRHLWVLSQLGITDDMLEKLETPTSS